MALTHVNAAGSAFDPVPRPAAPYVAALQSLPRLHAEAGTNLRLATFLARSAPATLILMLAGVVALALTSLAGGGTLKADFAWAAMLLFGIIAMICSHIRGFARSLRRVPLEEAAADLRMLLFYVGAAWGSGAFLIMPALPAPALALAFGLLPGIALALCLKDPRGVAFFVLPVTAASAGAALFAGQDLATVAALLALGSLPAGLPALQHRTQTPSSP